MALIDSAYDYYVSNYVNSEVSRYDTHKKDDLRRISNRIIKVNKEAPLYKISNPESAKRYAIDIKENAKSLLHVVASLADNCDSCEDSFQKKIAISSDEEKVGVTYIGDGSENGKTDQFRIEIQDLAAPQANTGNYLPDAQCSIQPGSYAFDMDTPSAAYEFQYDVSEGETNLEIITKLTRLINASNLGITAEVLSDNAGSSAMSLTSLQTGLSSRENSLFSIYPNGSSESAEAMGILGIDQVSQPAHNSRFLINGALHESFSNTYTINNAFELKLNAVTGDEPATIGFKSNADAIADNIQTLVDAYNKALHTASGKSGFGSDRSDDSNNANAPDGAIDTGGAASSGSLSDSDGTASSGSISGSGGAGSRLYRDMALLSRSQRRSLENIGLLVLDDASISIDRESLSLAVSPERADDTFETLSLFRDAIGDTAQGISVDPMNYVSKVIIVYKNPGHNFATPYISSLYSGMLLDEYV